MTTMRKLGLIAAAAVTLAGCSTISKVEQVNPFHGKKPPSAASRANRIAIVALDEQLKVADTLKGQDFYLPPPAPMADWPVAGGTPEQSVENVDAAPAFQVAWKKGFGRGSGRKAHVTAPPIMAQGRVYVMDGEAEVSAHDAQTGQQIWRVDIMPKSRRDHEAFGGGIAFSDGKLYVSSGFREVVQLDAATGAIGWRARTDAPLHAAPMVADGRVFVVDVNDEMLTFMAATGAEDWTYQAVTEPARILAASSPSVSSDTVVGSFASGELVALRASNGNELWSANLSRASRTNALSEIRDIAGRPVIYKNDVYAVSHSNVMAATDLRTGIPRWTLPVSAITTPWASGDVVYVVDQAGQVICASRESGQVYWIRDLNAGRKKKQRAYWSSPVMASTRLITVSSKGEAVALNPKTGEIEKTLKIGESTLIGPIAAGGMIYVATDGGELVAIR
ncbi:MAG TPA: PQQ-binding-like beta-propeller repeat protein [Caulobacteraceae bacterium]|nr:PQQ-binding-like beta-propeller repeat protein [Caulobacteraceae bacterium]